MLEIAVHESKEERVRVSSTELKAAFKFPSHMAVLVRAKHFIITTSKFMVYLYY